VRWALTRIAKNTHRVQLLLRPVLFLLQAKPLVHLTLSMADEL
jgi:hypothetical protein